MTQQSKAARRKHPGPLGRHTLVHPKSLRVKTRVTASDVRMSQGLILESLERHGLEISVYRI